MDCTDSYETMKHSRLSENRKISLIRSIRRSNTYPTQAHTYIACIFSFRIFRMNLPDLFSEFPKLISEFSKWTFQTFLILDSFPNFPSGWGLLFLVVTFTFPSFPNSVNPWVRSSSGIFFFFRIVTVTNVNQNKLHSMIQFALDRTKQCKVFEDHFYRSSCHLIVTVLMKFPPPPKVDFFRGAQDLVLVQLY